MQTPEQFQTLLKAYLENTISPADEAVLMEAIASGAYREHIGNEIIASLQTVPATGSMTAGEKARILDQVLASSPRILAPVRPMRRYRVVAAAAAVITIIAAATLIYRNSHKYTSPETPQLASVNTGKDAMAVQLEDGSTIVLAPGAKLTYPAHFGNADRKVHLEGNAFFKIAPNANQPFYAYSKGYITHVLGTSFNITSPDDKGLKIAVLTGKVEVMKDPAGKATGTPSTQSAAGQPEPVVLFPNQQVLTGSQPLKASLVDTPVVITGRENTPDQHQFSVGAGFHFKAVALKEIFAQMQKHYGIEIVLQNPALGNDLFTGDLSHETLFTALQLVCLSVDARYEIKGTQILINENSNLPYEPKNQQKLTDR